MSPGSEKVRRREDVLSRKFIDGLDASRSVSDSIHCEFESCHAKSEAVLCASHISGLPSSDRYMSASQSAATISNLNSLPLNLGQPA